MIQLENVCKVYPGNPPIGPFHAEVTTGSCWALTGESGTGKSTLLNLIGCMDTPTEGTVVIDGTRTNGLADRDLSALRLNKIGFVHQFFDLLPEISAIENVMVPLWLAQANKPEEQARNALKQVDLEDRADQTTHKLSGGQRQRVAIARAIVLKPQILLADEPTGSLDAKNSDAILDLLLALQEQQHCTLILATHSQRITERMPARMHLANQTLTMTEQ